MKHRFRRGELEVEIRHEPQGLSGCGCITLELHGVAIRLTLEDAESIGDKMIECVRAAEHQMARK